MEYNIKLVLVASKDLVGLIFSQYQWPSHLVILKDVCTFTYGVNTSTYYIQHHTNNLLRSQFFLGEQVR